MSSDQKNEDDRAPKLPPLVGSDKQLAWALEIRNARAAEAALMRSGWTWRVPREQAEAYLKSLPIRILAHWWIETRHLPIQQFLLAANEPRIEPPYVLPAPPSEQAQAVLAEATLVPGKVKGPTAEISLANGVARVMLSDFDKDANAVLKGSGYGWDKPAWVRAVPDDVAAHRAAEIAVRLLAYGCPVCLFDEALRQRVVNHDYEPESPRRVEVSTNPKYSRKFRLTWALDTEAQRCMQAARDLHGARVFGDAAYVSASHFEDIEDFAQRNGFAITPEAQALIEAQRQKLLGAVTINARPKAAPGIPAKPKRVPAMGAIDDDLRDE